MNFDNQIKKMLGKKKNSSNSFSMGSFPKMNMKPFSFPKMNMGLPKSKDWDGDGVPNAKDCQPRNVMRQDIMFPKNFYL